MKFDLQGSLVLSGDAANLKNDIENFISDINKKVLKKEDAEKSACIDDWKLDKNKISIHITSGRYYRAHSALLQIKNMMSKEFGKKHHVGVRELKIEDYKIEFELEKKALDPVSIPFANVETKDKQATIILQDVSEEFLQKNYIDRMISLVKEKVQNQYYEGKSEFWKPIWESKEKKPVWAKDPTEEMTKLGWLKQGPTKGKWFYRPQITAIFRAME